MIIDRDNIAKAGRLLREAAPEGSIVLLFGSHARGDAGPQSDLNFLVIEPEVSNQFAEMVRLRDSLRPLRVPVDVVVTSRRVFEGWRTTPNNVLYEAAREGRVMHEVG